MEAGSSSNPAVAGADGGDGGGGSEASIPLPVTDASVGEDASTPCEGSCIPKTCAAILAATPSAISGVFLIDPDGVGPQQPFNVFCDMERDEGGWTLLISLAPTTDTTRFNSPEAWPTTVSTESAAPTITGLYRGTLAPFHDVREEIASGGIIVYGRNKTLAELEVIRKQYGSQSRVASAANVSGRPPCRLSYEEAVDSMIGCCQVASASNGSTTLGWVLNPPGHSSGCWFARGAGQSDAGGSSLCDGEVDGTRWARTWFR
jgi:hypothetical protein